MSNNEAKEAKADAKAAKAKAKAMQPWYKKKRVIIPALLVLLIALIAIGTGSDSNDSTTANNSAGTSEEFRFSDRPDKQDVDVEVLPGEAAEIEGMSMTVDSFEYKASLNEFETASNGEEYLVVTVSLVNNSDEVKAYNAFNYRVQTDGGQVLDASFSGEDDDLSSGDLVAGGSVKGSIVFEVPQEDGNQYLLWAPSYSSQRGVVQLSE